MQTSNGRGSRPSTAMSSIANVISSRLACQVQGCGCNWQPLAFAMGYESVSKRTSCGDISGKLRKIAPGTCFLNHLPASCNLSKHPQGSSTRFVRCFSRLRILRDTAEKWCPRYKVSSNYSSIFVYGLIAHESNLSATLGSVAEAVRPWLPAQVAVQWAAASGINCTYECCNTCRDAIGFVTKAISQYGDLHALASNAWV